MSKYIVAVSGGVDSIVLLDMLVKAGEHELVVAHFDHGIREDSADDAEFVRQRAESYGLPFEVRRENLGSDASEDLARERRYAFLRQVAVRYGGKIATAHHADDAVETVAINFHRGTNWRGIAVLSADDVERPLIGVFKSEILDYARLHNLEWREDSTNAEDSYLRNRLRRSIDLTVAQKLEILALRSRQVELRHQIKDIVSEYIHDSGVYDRHFFIMVDSVVAIEILKVATGFRLTYPQLERALLAIKVARSGKVHQAQKTVKFSFTSRQFTVQLLK